MDSTSEHVDTVREYAKIRRGEHPSWKGDRIANAETFAWRIGYDYPIEAGALVQSLRDAEREYSLLTGLPPRSIYDMRINVHKGMRAALKQAHSDGR